MKNITPLEKALILAYLHADQLIKNLDIVLHELKVLKDPRAGKFQSLLEKLQGAAKRAFENVDKNFVDKAALEAELLEINDNNWDMK